MYFLHVLKPGGLVSLDDALCAKNSKSKLVLLEHGYSNEDINNMEADFVCADLKNFCKVISSL